MVAIVVSSTGRSPVYPPLPKPNGYDDFLSAAALINPEVRQSSSLDREGLRQLVSSNVEPLRLIRVGLGRHCSIPTEEAVTNFAAISPALLQIRLIVILLAAEGRLAEIEDRLGDAARTDLEAIRFGNEISRGGLMIHRSMGVGCESFGGIPLAKLVPKLNCEQARPLIMDLERIDLARVTWDEVLKNEKIFMRYELRQTANPINHLASWWIFRGTRKRAADQHAGAVAHLRLLAVELALRCYQAEQGRAPAGLQLLVPKYLQRVPLDPFSGQSLVYRTAGTNYLLYSVGADRIDDGGQPIGRPIPGTDLRGDLFFDSPW